MYINFAGQSNLWCVRYIYSFDNYFAIRRDLDCRHSATRLYSVFHVLRAGRWVRNLVSLRTLSKVRLYQSRNITYITIAKSGVCLSLSAWLAAYYSSQIFSQIFRASLHKLGLILPQRHATVVQWLKQQTTLFNCSVRSFGHKMEWMHFFGWLILQRVARLWKSGGPV